MSVLNKLRQMRGYGDYKDCGEIINDLVEADWGTNNICRLLLEAAGVSEAEIGLPPIPAELEEDI